MASRPPLPADYRRKTYRDRVKVPGLVSFQVVCEQTDLMIRAEHLLEKTAQEAVIASRGEIEAYIRAFPAFVSTLAPWPATPMAPKIVREMIDAGQAAGVGPMAAVAGAIAESVGRVLLDFSSEVVVENGGDVFAKTKGPLVAALFAGTSPFSMRVGVRVADTGNGLGLCTSSGTVGPSLSCGLADAVCVVSESAALADAAATAIGNRVRSPEDIDAAIEAGCRMDGIRGIVVIIGERIGAWGAVELVPLKGKKH